MFIKRIKLHKYKRFALSDSDTFEKVFTTKMAVITGPNGSGKAQPLSSKIKTPGGWKKMGEMTVGTVITAKDGTSCRVTGVYPQGLKEVFKLTFEDGRSTRSTLDHLWKIYTNETHLLESKVVKTKELIELLDTTKQKSDGGVYVWIDLPESEVVKKQPLVTNPYQLGLAVSQNRNIDSVRIDDEYFSSSSQQRIELLQGLLDVAGSVDSNGCISYQTQSFYLACRLVYLVRSLGCKACSVKTQSGFEISISYTNGLELFTLNSKKELLRRKNCFNHNAKLRLMSIEPDGLDIAQCISIDHPDKLYVTDGFIVTHNSSLVSELSPLPSDKNHFDKGGYKEVEITHNGSEYLITSDFTSSATYSFVKNDVEFNPSGLISIQKELSDIHFSITPIVHDILSGQELFTEMSLLARKKLFSAITHLNIDAILSNYNNLKDELRSNELTLKTLSSRLMSEQDKLNDATREIALNDQLKVCNEEINLLLGIRDKLKLYDVNSDMAELYNMLSDQINEFVISRQQSYLLLSAYPESMIPSYLIEKKEKIALVKYQLSDLYTELEKLLQNKKDLESIGEKDLDVLQSQLQQANIELATLISRLSYFTVETSYSQTSQGLSTLEAVLPDIVNEMQSNPNRDISKTSYTSLIESKNKTLQELNDLIRNISVTETTVLRLKQTDAYNCPSCHHTWTDQKVVLELSDLQTTLQSYYKQQAVLQKRITDIDPVIASQSVYLSQLLQLNSLYSHTKDKIAKFWHVVNSESMIYTNPRSLIVLCRQMQIELNLIEAIQAKQLLVDKLKNDVDICKDNQGLTQQSVTVAIQNTELEITHLQISLQSLQNELRDIEVSYATHSKLNRLNSVIASLKQSVQSANLSYATSLIVQECDTRLSLLKVSLIETQRLLSQQAATQGAVNMIKMSIDDTVENIKVLNIILTELSPKNGYIAKTISSFLNTIIQSVNSVIGAVWDYDMSLRAIDVEEDALNYKFKVDVRNNHPVEDISKISSGMKEIANLGLKITLFKLLKLQGYPISLDEFGVRLDNIHRARISSLVFQMLTSNMYSQIFLVTHQDTAYSEMQDTQLIEL